MSKSGIGGAMWKSIETILTLNTWGCELPIPLRGFCPLFGQLPPSRIEREREREREGEFGAGGFCIQSSDQSKYFKPTP